MSGFDEIVAFHNQLRGDHINLTPDQIYLVGRVIVQWTPLQSHLNFLVSMWRSDPTVPKDIRQQKVRKELSRKLEYLRTLSELVFRGSNLKQELQQRLGRIEACKNKRDWFAHSAFALRDQKRPHVIGISYNNHKSWISHDKIEQLINEISLLTGYIMSIDFRRNADLHRALHRKLLEQTAAVVVLRISFPFLKGIYPSSD